MQKLNTWAWVLSSNFSEGVPYTIVNTMLVALLADMGASNGIAVLIPALLSLPWMWKFLWAPVVDSYSTKRRWMVAMQFIIGTSLLAISLFLDSGFALTAVIVASAIIAISSATYDVACDGFYMIALQQKQQSFFVGIRSTAYRLGMLFASGFLLILAKDGSVGDWQFALVISAVTIITLMCLHDRLLLPHAESATTKVKAEGNLAIKEVLKTFLQLHHGRELVVMLLFIFTYRLGEAFLWKVTMLFLKASPEAGGLGLNNEQYGYLYGTFGTLALVAGGILGGICISRWGLKRCIIPMALALNLPDLLYVFLSQTGWTSPDSHLPLIGLCVGIEQLGYGFGFTAYTVYLLQCAKGPFETSHYAFLTALMSFGLLIPSAISGFIQEAMSSYSMYFIIACVLTIPGFIMAFVVRNYKGGAQSPAN